MQAIDLYSGVGGWALGLRLAGIKVLASYERSRSANETNRRNNDHMVIEADLRSLDFASLPEGVTTIVGSPPCTQFSYSNRGGSGDLADGLEDVKRFLEIVDHLRPAVWAMENVPRLSRILDAELARGGALAKFRHLGIRHEIFDMQEFGLPQKRLRCIAGNVDFDLLKSYRQTAVRRNLGAVIGALRNSPVVDPLFGFEMSSRNLVDHRAEEPLDPEEERINRSLKTLHPIYNSMLFPDELSRPSRTITATCTRVSRESIIIPAPERPARYRRLTVRERACCQGFPISFQFYGRTYGEKLKMVGNAIPPLFAYYVGHAMRGTSFGDISPPIISEAELRFEPAFECAAEKRVLRYRHDRRFQFAIPSLRLKSGVRFELVNKGDDGRVDWHIKFVFGTSKAIQTIRPIAAQKDALLACLPGDEPSAIAGLLNDLRKQLSAMDFAHMQAVWSHRGPGATRPFMLLDLIDEFSREVRALLEQNECSCRETFAAISTRYAELFSPSPSGRKLAANAATVLAGFLIAGTTNSTIDEAIGTTQPVLVREPLSRKAV
jgi:DNA (cytosine-5)-methyltransferase 1